MILNVKKMGFFGSMKLILGSKKFSWGWVYLVVFLVVNIVERDDKNFIMFRVNDFVGRVFFVSLKDDFIRIIIVWIVISCYDVYFVCIYSCNFI